MAESIVVTGMGAITPLGCGVETYWDALVAGECGVGTITRFPPEEVAQLPVRIAAEVKPYDLAAWMPKKLIRQSDAFSQYAYVAAEQALADQKIADADRIGLVVGTAMGGIVPALAGQQVFDENPRKHVSPRMVPRVLGNIAGAHISIAHQLRGPCLTISTACASGNDALIHAALLLQADSADAMLVVGTESILSPVVVDSLAAAGALSKENDDPARACRPFDEERSGFVIGEGGGALLLERRSHAEARGARIYGEMSGWAANNDAYHITAPQPQAIGAKACMVEAMKMAGLRPSEVGYLNAHGTATAMGDAIEAAAIAEVFRDDQPRVSSTKGATGHMMGAGGVTEAIACLMALETGTLPPNLNLEHPCCDLDLVRVGDAPVSINATMTNAFGFGGQNSTLVFRRVS